MPPRSTPPTQPTIITVGVPSGAAESTMISRPLQLYSLEAEGRATKTIGLAGYGVLRTKALQQFVGQLASVNVLLAPLEQLVDERDALDRAGPGWAEAVNRVELVGRETHWHAIHRIGQAVEGLCAVISALDDYRAGAGPAIISSRLVRHDLDLRKVLDAKTRRKLSYWERLAGRPSHEAFVASGLSPADAASLLASNRRYAVNHMHAFQQVAKFYTPSLHQVYTKYRHGYTLVDPALSPIAFDGVPSGLDLEEIFRHAFVVMHEGAEGRRVIHVVKTGVREIRLCLDVARFVLQLTRHVANAWLLELEHPAGRVVTFDSTARDLAWRWAGQGLRESLGIDLAPDPIVEPSAEPRSDEELT